MIEYVFESYGFSTLWSPSVLITTFVLATLYITLTGPFRYLFPDSAPVRIAQRIYFLMGLLIFYISLGSPLHVLGDYYFFSAHMLEQSLMYMVVPPLILLGTPTWMLRPLWTRRKMKKILSVVTNPVFSILSFNVLFSFYHLPIVFDYVVAHEGLHILYHGILLLAAFQMWWMITSPVPEVNSLSELKKMGYMIMDTLLLYPACVLIIFASEPMYNTFAHASPFSDAFSPLEDQQVGGIIMKLIQEIVFIIALGVIFKQWYRKENKKNEVTEGYNIPGF